MAANHSFDGKSVRPVSPQFEAAHEGKAREPEKPKAPTEEQQKSAEKVVAIENQPTANAADLKSAKSRLAFNVNSEGVKQVDTTAEKPKHNEPLTYAGRPSRQPRILINRLSYKKVRPTTINNPPNKPNITPRHLPHSVRRQQSIEAFQLN